MMATSMKPSKKYTHLHAIVRYAKEASDITPLELRFQIVKLVEDPNYALQEANRLSQLNEAKGYHYFVQIARFEEPKVEAQPVPPIQLPPPDEASQQNAGT
jgi:hypothetical protein